MPPPSAKRIAPDLSSAASDARQFIHTPDYHGAATDVASYIRESIVNPDAFVLPKFRYLTMDGTSVMPKNFATLLTPAQIDDLIVYILTLQP